MKENNEINENEIIEKINKMLNNVIKLKKEGNNLIKLKKYENAEQIYRNAINIMNNFETEQKFEMNNEIKKEKGKEIILIMEQLYSNLSLVQGKQLKYLEGIQTASYIIANLNGMHIKSYLRIMNWLLELNEINTAKELKNEIINKFKNDNNKINLFQNSFNLLQIKEEQIKLKANKNKNKTKNNQINLYKYIKIGGILIGVGLLINLCIELHKKNKI